MYVFIDCWLFYIIMKDILLIMLIFKYVFINCMFLLYDFCVYILKKIKGLFIDI